VVGASGFEPPNKLATDTDYREHVGIARKNSGRETPAIEAVSNEAAGSFPAKSRKPRLLKALHQLSLSVKNSFVFDLRTLDAGIWLISDGVSSGKNILASAKIVILQGKLSDLAGRPYRKAHR
jgi:hypothetical protein